MAREKGWWTTQTEQGSSTCAEAVGQSEVHVNLSELYFSEMDGWGRNQTSVKAVLIENSFIEI